MTADERDPSVTEGAVEDIDEAFADDRQVSEDDVDQVMDAAAANGADPVEQLRGLVVWLVDQLMDEPETVSIEAVERGSAVQIQVRLPEADLGKIIGRGGRIAKSIRTALMIAGSRHHLRVSLDIEGQD
jgi:predicted RNA-binding protein YlqC (UPF0109 family)